MSWQPIETAPRDVDVFIYMPGWPCAPKAKFTFYPGNPVCDANGEDAYMSGWVWQDEYLFTPGYEDGFLGWDDDPMPTHWSPVPDPPA